MCVVPGRGEQLLQGVLRVGSVDVMCWCKPRLMLVLFFLRVVAGERNGMIVVEILAH